MLPNVIPMKGLRRNDAAMKTEAGIITYIEKYSAKGPNANAGR